MIRKQTYMNSTNCRPHFIFFLVWTVVLTESRSSHYGFGLGHYFASISREFELPTSSDAYISAFKGLLGSVYVLIFLANGRDKKYNIRKEKIKSKTKKNKLRVKPEATYIYKDRTYLNQMRITFEYSHCKPLLRI